MHRHGNLGALVKSVQWVEHVEAWICIKQGGEFAYVFIFERSWCFVLYSLHLGSSLTVSVIAFSHPSPLGLKDLRRSLSPSSLKSIPAETCVNTLWSPSRCRARSNTLSIKTNIRITSYNACNWIHTDKISTPNSMGWDGDLITQAPRLPGLESDWAHYELTGKKCVRTCVFWL